MLFVSKHYDLLFLKMIYSENFDEEYKTNRDIFISFCQAVMLCVQAKLIMSNVFAMALN